jgi:uncharacterized protein (DUF305 family)
MYEDPIEARITQTLFGTIKIFGIIAVVAITSAMAQEPTGPVIVQPGAPGQPSRQLPAATKGVLPPQSGKNVEFMQGMIMHHGQAVEMTALIEARTKNNAVRLLGERISKSQSDEMLFMRRWLEVRSEPVSMSIPMASVDHAHAGASAQHQMLMPGMLTPKQMEALRNAKDAEFDRLFLTGMIQHHEGALVMVKELFNSAGAGQDAELFNFASDVDSGQRAEIRSMQTILNKDHREER